MEEKGYQPEITLVSGNPPPLPKPPPFRLIREWDNGPMCEICGSSLKKKYLFFRTKYCIQSECNNYYKRFEKINFEKPIPLNKPWPRR